MLFWPRDRHKDQWKRLENLELDSYKYTQLTINKRVSCSVISDSLRSHGLEPTELLCPWYFPGKNTVVGCHFLLQGIFPIQGSNSGLWHCRQILYHCIIQITNEKHFQFSSVQSLRRVRLFATPWIAAHQASLFITISRSSLRLTSEAVMPSSHLILSRPLLLSSCP